MTTSPRSKLALGVDLVTISRISRLLSDFPTRFQNFAFTKNEQQYCENQTDSDQHYAARWAVKEAYIKAVGVQNANPDLTTIEIIREPTPHLVLSGEAKDLLSEAAEAHKIAPEDASITISLAHEMEANLAIGIVVILF